MQFHGGLGVRKQSSSELPRIVFVNRYYFPDQSATSQLLTDLTTELAGRGHEIVVITSRQKYQDNRAMLPRRDAHRGVRVHRVRTTNFGRFRLRGRILDYLSFYLGAALRLRSYTRDGDIVVVMTDPPLMSIVARLVLSTRNVRRVNWLQDLFPEVAQQVGIPLSRTAPVRWLQRLRDWSLKGDAVNVTIGERMAERVQRAGAESVAVIHNWAVLDDIYPKDDAVVASKRAALGFDGAFVVGYSGNLGRVHTFDAMLQAARHFQAEERALSESGTETAYPPVRFVVFGGGYQSGALKEGIERYGLTNIRLEPYQPRSELGRSLSLPDIHWISLRPGFEGLIVPSKFYGVIAAGRPLIHVGAVDGEVAGLIAAGRCGYAVAEGDGAAFIAHVETLRRDPELCRSLGDNARTLYLQRFKRTRTWSQWSKLVEPQIDNAAVSDAPTGDDEPVRANGGNRRS